MRKIGVLEAKTRLSALLDEVESGGEDILITRHGRPVAKLSAFDTSPKSPRKYTGPELVERSKAFQARLSRESPEIDLVTWEELKDMMHR